jgi:hypothetical protein
MKVLLLIQIFISFLFLTVLTGCHQPEPNMNLNFEEVKDGWPINWSVYHQQPNYSVSLDSVNIKSGKYAASIEFTGNTINFQVLNFSLPHNYNGRKITLSAYIKTENVIDGFAGLWLMMDPDPSYDNIEISGVKVAGTTDWKRYETTLDMDPANTNEIVVGGLLTGKGKMWLDDLKVTVDGMDIKKAQPYQPKSFPANNDREFDNGSNVTFPKLNEQKIDDLTLLGRIWGFLKYHHPEIAKGNYNWDYELFRILPDYMNANDRQQRDQILLNWIDKYGRILKCKTCQATSDSAIVKPDLSWIEQCDINSKLKDLLHKIYSNRNQGSQYYIKMAPYFGTPIFTNESMYEAMDSPDAGFRLLALFRYWNMIYYFFPYKHLTDKNWDSVLKEYIPHFIKAESRLAYELSAALLIGEICDSHAYPLGGWKEMESLKGSRQVPVRLQFIENKLVVMENYAKNIELNRGDIITRIEGKTVEAIVDSMKRYYSASNDVTKMRDITNDILRSNKHFVQIEYNSSDKMKQKEIYTGERTSWMIYKFRKDTTQSFKFTGEDIGYINLSTLQKKDIPVIRQAFINTKGIIIDIRNYPPDFVINMLCPYFVTEFTPYSRHTQGNIDNPGEFIYLPFFDIINKSEEYYPGMLVIIVNEETQSRAEGMTMAFQAGGNSTIIGSTTAGSAGNVSWIILPGGLGTQITGNITHYPDGKETERVGIIPNFEITPTVKGIREGRDELLEKAIEIICQK